MLRTPSRCLKPDLLGTCKLAGCDLRKTVRNAEGRCVALAFFHYTCRVNLSPLSCYRGTIFWYLVGQNFLTRNEKSKRKLSVEIYWLDKWDSPIEDLFSYDPLPWIGSTYVPEVGFARMFYKFFSWVWNIPTSQLLHDTFQHGLVLLSDSVVMTVTPFLCPFYWLVAVAE